MTSLSHGPGEAAPASHRRPDGLRLQGQVIGLAAIGLSVTSIGLIAVSAPWQLRLPFLAAAALFGPGVPLLRTRAELSLTECLVYGMGVDVGLQMLAGLAMVMAHVWAPVAASVVLLAISLLAGLKLTYDTRSTGEPQ